MGQLLMNICRVQVASSRQIANTTAVPGGILLNYWRDWTDLPIAGLAEYKMAENIVDKCRVYTHSITARMHAGFDAAGSQWAFLVTTVQGDRYLIGRSDAPYPIATVSVSMPSEETARSGYTLDVSWTSLSGLAKVLD